MSELPDIGLPPELAWLPVEFCSVDPRYQRTLETPRSQKLIEKIATEFSWMRFQALLATPMEDGWLIVDGQHRLAGAKKRGIDKVPAVVFPEASLADQARAFVGANKDRVAMTAQALYHAQLLAQDPEALIIGSLCEAERIKISPHNKSAAKFAAGETAAISMLRRILRKHGSEHLARTVNILNVAWGKEQGALQSGLFMAVSMYLAEGGDEAALCRTLPGHDWRKLLATAVNSGGAEHGRGRILCDTLKAWVATDIKSRANAGDSVTPRPGAAGDDPAGRLVAGRTATATEVEGRDSRERPAIALPPDRLVTAAIETLREADREVEPETSRIGQRWRLDGRQTATRDELIEIANRIRRRAGQPLLEMA